MDGSMMNYGRKLQHWLLAVLAAVVWLFATTFAHVQVQPPSVNNAYTVVLFPLITSIILFFEFRSNCPTMMALKDFPFVNFLYIVFALTAYNVAAGGISINRELDVFSLYDETFFIISTHCLFSVILLAFTTLFTLNVNPLPLKEINFWVNFPCHEFVSNDCLAHDLRYYGYLRLALFLPSILIMFGVLNFIWPSGMMDPADPFYCLVAWVLIMWPARRAQVGLIFIWLSNKGLDRKKVKIWPFPALGSVPAECTMNP
ncbi:MAG: hypothetical protein AAFQ87_07225 [Bacteroidota bacterium]